MFKSEEISYIFGVTGFLVMTTILLVCKSLYDRRKLLKFSRKFKGHTFYPIVGNGFHFLGQNLLTAMQGTIEKFGSPCNMWFAHEYNYLTSDPKDAKVILTHPNSLDKHSIYNHVAIFFENTLLVAPAEEWKKSRKFYSRSFNQPLLNKFVEYFYAKSNIFLEILKDSDDKDIFDLCSRLSFDSFCASIIGMDYDLQVKPKVPIVELLEEAQIMCANRLISGYYWPEVIWKNFLPSGRRAVKNFEIIKNLIFDILDERRKAIRENSRESVEDDKLIPLLELMLKSDMEDNKIFKEMVFFTTAATDTSGHTMAYTFALLGMHPEIQRQVYEEVIRAIGHDREIYHDDLPNLKFTERVILESMRLLPVVPLLGRHASGEIDLGHSVVPKGANLAISVIALHRNEKVWSDPLKFDPDRFLPEEVAKRDFYAYIPFSGGPRNCIGKTYGMMLMKTCVANVIRNYEIFSTNKSVLEFELESCVTMKAIKGLNCTFRPRKQVT